MSYRYFLIGAVAALNLVLTVSAIAQGSGDWGDAPEGALAYPWLGVVGNFPTCRNVGPPLGDHVHHATTTSGFGTIADTELEGNGGMCALFAPYDFDECFADGDAGLIFPLAYTIQGTSIVPCTAGYQTALGVTCGLAMWGVDIDIVVSNGAPYESYINVLMDWDQNGSWSGAAQCPQGAAPEHVLVNLAVPPGFFGPLSIVIPGSQFRIGPNTGYVWARFTISDSAVPPGWDGAGAFATGETEDYLLPVDGSVPVDDSSWGQIKATYR
jgi:hypothetical protein